MKKPKKSHIKRLKSELHYWQMWVRIDLRNAKEAARRVKETAKALREYQNAFPKDDQKTP